MCVPGEIRKPGACQALARLRAAFSVSENDESGPRQRSALQIVVSSEVRSVSLHVPDNGATQS
jgi:hypothetical protein